VTTWADLTAQFTLLLSDQGAAAGTPSYSEPLRKLAWNRAAQFFAVTHTANLKMVKAVPVASGDGLSIAKPADWLQIAGLTIEQAAMADVIILPLLIDHTSASKGYWLRPTLFVPGEIPDTTGYLDIGESLYFADRTINNATIWYYAFYKNVATDADVPGVPLWAEWALCNLAIAYMLIPLAIGVADLRRYETRRDAGQPEDNPSRIQADWHVKRYLDAIGKYHGQNREVAYR